MSQCAFAGKKFRGYPQFIFGTYCIMRIVALVRCCLKDKERCARVIEGYERDSIGEVSLKKNSEYFFAEAFRKMRRSGVLDFLEHSDKTEVSSWDAALKVLELCRDFIENNKGWDIIQSVPTNKAEKTVQRLL